MEPIIIHISHHDNRLFHMQINRIAKVQDEICPTLFIIYDLECKSYKLHHKSSKNIDEMFKFEGSKSLEDLSSWINDDLPQSSEKLIILEANIGQPGHDDLSDSFYSLAEKFTNHHIIPFTSTETCAEHANMWYQDANLDKHEFNLEIQANKQIACTQNYLLYRQKIIAENQDINPEIAPESASQSAYSSISATEIDPGHPSDDFVELNIQTEINDSTGEHHSQNSIPIESGSYDQDDTLASPDNLPLGPEAPQGGWCTFFCCGGMPRAVSPVTEEDEIQRSNTSRTRGH